MAALTEIENIVMTELSKRHIMTKSETRSLLEANGKKINSVDTVLSNLVEMSYIVPLSGVGASSYAITQKGINSMK
ncbi:MAG: hypothetical protein J4473_00135 [Candidatus Aenigmarchaeota archaeon]|nr:hypothetical protein [Candidatus Aenigmarchaeota archaeon]